MTRVEGDSILPAQHGSVDQEASLCPSGEGSDEQQHGHAEQGLSVAGGGRGATRGGSLKMRDMG